MVGNRGQESAPFELLIAVIVMGFVIFIGMRAMSDLMVQKCYGETDSKLEEMKTKLEIAVTQKSPQTLNFRLSSCFNEAEEIIKIKDFSEPQLCASYCGSAKSICTLLQYSYTGASGGFSIRKCLNISPDTVFPQTAGNDDSFKCKTRDKSELVNFRENIPQANYTFLNKTRATDTFPTICAYRSTE
jgi:hypothetical protein